MLRVLFEVVTHELDVPAAGWTLRPVLDDVLVELGDASGKRMADEWETEELLSLDLQQPNSVFVNPG